MELAGSAVAGAAGRLSRRLGLSCAGALPASESRLLSLRAPNGVGKLVARLGRHFQRPQQLLVAALNRTMSDRNMSWSPAASKLMPRIFDPVGQCIYCGARPPIPLTKEHVVPQGLGGGLILPRASCEICRQITQKIEESCLRKMLLPYRLRFDLVQREHEIKKAMEVMVESETAIETKVIPRISGPHYLLLPALEQPPGLLIGQPAGAPMPYHLQFAGNAEQLRELPGLVGANRVHFKAHVDVGSYIRMIAKIAHSFAVGQIGIDGFNADLRQFILGQDFNMASFLIGCSTVDLPIRSDALSHQVGLGILPWGPIQFVRVRVRLFARHNSPAYDVIVGRLAIPLELFESRVRPAPTATPVAIPQHKSDKARVRRHRGRSTRDR